MWSEVRDAVLLDPFTEAAYDAGIRDNLNSGATVLLASTTLVASAANIDFQSINQTFRSLVLVAYLRGDTAATFVNVGVRLNNDTAANYDYQFWQATNPNAFAGGEAFATTSGIVGNATANTGPASTFSPFVIRIPGYATTSGHKTIDAMNALKFGTVAGNLVAYGLGAAWRSTAAVNRVTVLPTAGNFVAGSRISVYGEA